MATSLDMPIAPTVFEPAVNVVETDVAVESPARLPASWPVRLWYGLCYVLEWLFGLASVIACLAMLAAVPIVNFLSLGYLLEASGRVARSGKIRDGFIDIAKFARIGTIVAGTWLCLLVPRLISSLASDAWLIDPDGFASRGWRAAQIAATLLVIGHVLLAWYSGGRLRHFLWPALVPIQLAWRLVFGRLLRPILYPLIRAAWPALASDLYTLRPLDDWFPPAILVAGLRRGRVFSEMRDAVWDFVSSLKLPHYFWLGVRGFFAALVWLIIPSLMLMAGTSGRGPVTIVVGYIGAIAMAYVVLHLPFLQTNFACQNRIGAMFDLKTTRAQFRQAPIAFWLALFVTLIFALPLYLLKIEPVLPPELRWLTTVFFILFIYPARLLTGWAVGRARRHERPRFFLVRWLARTACIPIVAAYVFILFFTQYTSFLGPASILEQHAFLLPVPFISL